MQDCQFIWGLVGNKEIGKYSIAPPMWKGLFEKKRIDVEYVIIGDDSSSNINSNIKKLLVNKKFIGVNIALPWKNLGFNLCEEVEEPARNVETINTLINRNGECTGYNTDGIGILKAITKITEVRGKNAFIIGAGSSAQTMPYHLMKEGINKIFIYDISPKKSEELKRKYLNKSKRHSVCLEVLSSEDIISTRLKETEVLINASYCGMKGVKQEYPFDVELLDNLPSSCICAEAVYTPYITPMLSYVQQKGNKICPGVKMLVEQAAESFFRGFGERLNLEDKLYMEELAKEALN